MRQHIELVGWIYIVMGALGIFAGLVVLVAVVVPGLLSGDARALTILSIVGGSISGFLLLISIPSVIAGIGLLKQRRWARVLTIVLAILSLFNIPIGTLIAIYTFWVLTNEETVKLLGATA